VVDKLLGEFQTVIKPLGKVFQQIRGIGGFTILGNGDVALILDVPGLMKQVMNHTDHQMSSSLLQA
jgi:two-component system chemotaxis sensor kinase CheA